MTNIFRTLVFLGPLLMIGSTVTLHAEVALPEPVWAREGDALYLNHQFLTNDPNSSPGTAENSHGLVLSEVFVDSPMGTGWRNPDNPDEYFAREESGGAWDLGPLGTISITIPTWKPDLETFPAGREVEFVVNVIGYRGLLELPTLSIAGHGMTGVSFQEGPVELDAPFGAWLYGSWSGTLTGVTENELTFLVSADPMAGSLVDTVEIHVIPEPAVSAAFLGLVMASLGALRLRRGRRS